MPINDQLRDSVSSAELAAHATVGEASRQPFSVLTINGGSSSIRFALHEGGEPLRRWLVGKVDRVGLSGTTLTFSDATGKSQDSRTVDADDPHSAVAFLPNWLETPQVFASVSAVGHRLMHGMTHTEPERVASELLDEKHRICEGLGFLGIEGDEARNTENASPILDGRRSGRRACHSHRQRAHDRPLDMPYARALRA